MTAGRGIVHAEMPRQNADGSPNIGMQLWVDLPRALKNCEPRYRDLRASEIPLATADNDRVRVKVISGRSYGVDSVQELAYTPVWLLDVEVKAGGVVRQRLPRGWNAFAYILSGNPTFFPGTTEEEIIPKYHNVVFTQQGDEVVATVPEGEEEARFIIVAGLPLDQEIVQYGPFVVSSHEEIYKALSDYQGFKNGFERAEGWRSEIGGLRG